MDRPAGIKAGLSDYLAAERTVLAWIRTGLALMGFGFVVAWFGLFLQEAQVVQPTRSAQSYGLSVWFGTALIVVGIVVNIFSGWRHLQMIGELNRGETSISRFGASAVAIAFFLALIGLAMAIFLVSVRNSAGTNKETSIMLMKDEGIVDTPSGHTVAETVERLKKILEAKGVTLFAFIDHSAEAEKVGMKIPPTKLLIFGNPKGGTPLMLAAPYSAIDLPLKILVWEDTQGKVWVTYNSPEYLQARHGLPPELIKNIAVVETFATKASE